MRNGPLRCRMQYQEPTRARDDVGQVRDTWTDVAPCWVEKVDLTGREAVVNEQLRAETTHLLRTKRTSFRVRAKGRFLWTSRGSTHVYQVLSSVDRSDGREAFFEHNCKEVPA